MHAVSREKQRRRVVVAVAVVGLAAFVLCAVLSLTSFIEGKLNQSAEHQVVTFTEQAAGGVSDRMFMVQNAIGSFAVQVADPDQVVPALAAFRDRNGFVDAAFAGLDGIGRTADGSPFSTSDIEFEETALSQGQSSYSDTFVNDEGACVRLAQQPLYLDGDLAGALYVQIPLSMFTLPRHLDMFDGRGYFMLFQADTGEVLVPPRDETQAPLAQGDSIFDFLDEAAHYTAPESFDSAEEAGDALRSLKARENADLGSLRDTVDSGATGLIAAPVEGKASYVCVAPVGEGHWYVCSVVPVGNVRAEADVVATTFQVVFGIVIVCLVAVGLLAFFTYRRRVRERNVDMLSQLYEALSDSIEMAVNLYSPADGQVTPIVAKARSIIGYSMRDFLKNPDLARAIRLSERGTRLFDRIRAGQVDGFEQGEFSFRGSEADCTRWAAYSVKPLVFDEKPQLLIVLRDATADKKIQLSMKDAMDAAESANQAKSEFLSRMSHEIRTPMNVIIGMLQIARGNVDDPVKTRENLDKIGAASDHLLGLINDVLDLSKIENGKMTLTSEPFCLADIVEDVLAVVRAQCEAKGLDLDARMPDGAEGVFVGDSMRLKQLLLNLLTNAVKYTPAGGHVRFEGTVSPGAVMGYRQITFVVSDDGIGMSAQFQERLFEPFVMEGRSREQGTGLGMPIVKTIVSLMGGSIDVDSAEGRGTTFKVALNLRIAMETERQAFADGRGSEGAAARAGEKGRSSIPAMAAPVPPAIDPGDLAGLRVLLAEDNDLNAEIACELLSEAGLKVDWARDGREACDLFKGSAEGFYDVVLMDVQMPNMNGYDATRCIRGLARADAAGVPIIAMSANAFSEDVRASLASGMNAHLSKPIDMRRVLASILEHVRG
ncbi:hybrid sensor histidine kinase/response regulator [Arabiibacter massiliensis]|uniref:hybrid sensor histidine kinase/response regulator n=1 Tax=Arabiibacter massiliensis TaxID=1870985 RepID=UPI0009BC3795|nr:ATP-binding protein [Arabiibacter massiliensis]